MKTSRFQHLESVKDDPHTLIFYEAPHKLLSTLEDMSKVRGPAGLHLPGVDQAPRGGHPHHPAKGGGVLPAGDS